jgi:hypothetical protein
MIKVLPATILVILFIWFISTYRIREEKLFEQIDNGCLVYSLHFKHTLEAQERLEPYLWTRVLAIQFYKTIAGHAVTVFVYKNMTFIYDPNRGSFVAARTPLYDPMTLAEICFPKLAIKDAAFLEPTITLEKPVF